MSKCDCCGQEVTKTKAKKVKEPKVKKFEGSEDKWMKLAANLAFYAAPAVFPCKRCGYPVLDGYCCDHCGSDSPGSPDDSEYFMGFDV
jgi:hypothetical protein